MFHHKASHMSKFGVVLCWVWHSRFKTPRKIYKLLVPKILRQPPPSAGCNCKVSSCQTPTWNKIPVSFASQMMPLYFLSPDPQPQLYIYIIIAISNLFCSKRHCGTAWRTVELYRGPFWSEKTATISASEVVWFSKNCKSFFKCLQWH